MILFCIASIVHIVLYCYRYCYGPICRCCAVFLNPSYDMSQP